LLQDRGCDVPQRLIACFRGFIFPSGFDIAARLGNASGVYESSGKLKWIGTTQSFASGFTKREFVITTAHNKYPQDIKFELVKDKCSLLDNFETGQEVHVNFDIRGNEYNGKYYVNLACWKLQAADGAAAAASAKSGQKPSQAEPDPADLRNSDDFDDEPPF